ncbi:MAG: HDIG domain-containing protein [Chloroflexi bacterium]|nr:HDIG domain-containing protein [Chloroflexota bacterium]
MAINSSASSRATFSHWVRRITMAAIGVGFAGGAAAIMLGPILPASPPVALIVGQAVPQDILAPISITYVSQVLTEQARESAVAAVSEIYDPPDTRVARAQVSRIQQVLNYLTSVRADSFATTEQHVADVAAVTDLTMPRQLAATLVGFSDAQWPAVQSAVVAVVEQVMSRQVRADRFDDARRSVPALVSVQLSEDQAAVVTAIAQSYLAPNSFFNEAATQAARTAARDAVAPVSQSFVEGQVVVSRGRVVTAADLEALEALGLRKPQIAWQDFASRGLAVAIGTGVLGLYLYRYHPAYAASPRHVLVLAMLFLIFLFGAKLMVPDHVVLPFLFPAAGLAMLMTVTLGPHLAIGACAVLAAWIGLMSAGRLDIVAYSFVGATVAALSLGRAERIYSFLWAGLLAGVSSAGVILIFRLPDPTTDPVGLVTLLIAGLANGIASASVTLAGFVVLGNLFDITTGLQLIELARPNHPLLQFILRQAPGTYQHSLQVANLAEQAAERLGANPMLTRVGALYHDAGKALNPQYFVENQVEGENIHDRLDPQTSVKMIIQHVADGTTMARRHRLPKRLAAFVTEHHGTLRASYQYQRALKEAGGDASKVDEAAFRYPGPRPQSVETALLMLADGCEAKARSDRPRTVEDIDRIAKKVIDDRVAQGQLDECPLTLRDLQIVRESFVATLKGMFHGRLQYPEEEKPAQAGP